MSSSEVKLVLNQVLNDDTFAELFRTDPQSTLVGFDLTKEEKDALLRLDLSEIEQSDIRVSHEMDPAAIRVGSVYID